MGLSSKSEFKAEICLKALYISAFQMSSRSSKRSLDMDRIFFGSRCRQYTATTATAFNIEEYIGTVFQVIIT